MPKIALTLFSDKHCQSSKPSGTKPLVDRQCHWHWLIWSTSIAMKEAVSFQFMFHFRTSLIFFLLSFQFLFQFLSLDSISKSFRLHGTCVFGGLDVQLILVLNFSLLGIFYVLIFNHFNIFFALITVDNFVYVCIFVCTLVRLYIYVYIGRSICIYVYQFQLTVAILSFG